MDFNMTLVNSKDMRACSRSNMLLFCSTIYIINRNGQCSRCLPVIRLPQSLLSPYVQCSTFFFLFYIIQMYFLVNLLSPYVSKLCCTLSMVGVFKNNLFLKKCTMKQMILKMFYHSYLFIFFMFYLPIFSIEHAGAYVACFGCDQFQS